MAASLIAGMRIWVAFVTFISLSVTISYYGYLTSQINNAREQGVWEDYLTGLRWGDICSIITSVILFGIYAYSACTRNKVTSLIQNKFLRAILILIPTGLLLYLNCRAINSLLIIQNIMNDYRRNHFADSYDETSKLNMFVCDKEVPLCFLMLSHMFLAVITGVFVVVEVAMSFFLSSPHSSPKTVDL